MPRGGKREGAGRKKKADEQRLRDMISPYREDVIETVLNIMRTAERDADRLAAAKLLMSYDWGLPKQVIDMDINERPIFKTIDLDVQEDNGTS